MTLVRYLRAGKESREWEQRLLLDTGRIIVTSFIFELKKPFSHMGSPLIENGFRGVMYDPFDRWYNVVEVMDQQGRLKGYYSDIRTPPIRIEDGYEAMDLLLDLWVYPDCRYLVLDEDEFQETYLSPGIKRMALNTLDHLERKIKKEGYPPGWVKEVRKEDWGIYR